MFRHKFLLSCLLNGVLYGLFLLFFTPRMSFDDIQMSLIVSGLHYSQSPSELLLFSHVGLGLFFKNLYSVFPETAWYGMYLLFSSFLASVGLLWALWECDFSLLKTKLYLVFFGLFCLFVLLFPTFTTIATFSGLAGWLLLNGHFSTKNAVFSAILLLNSFLLRNDSFLLASLFALFFAFGNVEWKKNSFQIPKKKLFFSLSILLIASLLYIADQQYYQQKNDLKETKTYLSNITKILDFNYLPYGAYRHAYQKVGWSENDHKMLRSWYFMDTAVFGQETMQKALAEVEVLSVKFIKQRGVKENFQEIFLRIFQTEYALLSLVFSLFLVFFPHFSQKKLLLFGLGLAFMSSNFFILLMFRKLPLNHVGFLYFAFLPLLLLFFSETTFVPKTLFSWQNGVILAVLLAILVFRVPSFYQQSQAHQSQIAAYKRFIAGLNKGKLHIGWSYSPIYHGYGLFENAADFKNCDLLHVGTFNYPPIVQNTLTRYQIKNLYLDAVDNPNVLFLSDTVKLEYFAQYLFEHHQKKVTWKKEKDLEGLEIYRIISKD